MFQWFWWSNSKLFVNISNIVIDTSPCLLIDRNNWYSFVLAGYRHARPLIRCENKSILVDTFCEMIINDKPARHPSHVSPLCCALHNACKSLADYERWLPINTTREPFDSLMRLKYSWKIPHLRKHLFAHHKHMIAARREKPHMWAEILCARGETGFNM